MTIQEAKALSEWFRVRKGKTLKLNDKGIDCVIESLEKQIPKKPIRKEMPYNEEVGFNDEWHCPICGAYVGYFTEGMNEPEQMEYCNECGQRIAKDWSENND